MLVNWRGKEYNYNSNVLRFRPDTRQDVLMPICGMDTESTDRGAKGTRLPDAPYECQCVTFATPTRKGIRWVEEGSCALEVGLYELLGEVKAVVDHKKTLFTYIHNLSYDTGQLFKGRADLMTFARTGSYDNAKLKNKPGKRSQNKAEYFIGRIRNRDCYLRNRALFTGSAPHFSVRCYRTRKDYVDIKFLDSGSYFRGSLANIAKELDLDVMKQERQEDIGFMDYRGVPDSDPRKQQFAAYAIDDAVIVQKIGEAIVQLHKEAGFTAIRSSSPGFAYSYFLKFLDELKTVIYSGSFRQEDIALALDSYGGGRTGGIYHGVVDGNLTVVDFASSYPASMATLPTFTPKMKYRRLKGAELRWPVVKNWLKDFPHAFLRIDGHEADEKYPSLITLIDGKLTPVYGDFEGIATTGAEVWGGVASGTLTVTKVHEAVFLMDMEPGESPFRKFATTAYSDKQKAKKGSIKYILAKLLLNSAYGKFIQSTKAQLLGSDIEEFIAVYPKGHQGDYAKLYLEKYAEAQYNGQDVLDVLEDVKHQVIKGAIEMGLELEDSPLDKMDTNKKEFAPSAIPPAAALITATSRARLRALIKCTGAIYWDTDSAFIKGRTNDEIEKDLATGSAWIHPLFTPLGFGGELGEIDVELEGAAGYLSGTKRYFLRGQDGDKEKVKVAIHGITNLYGIGHNDKIKRRYSEAIIRRLAVGGSVRYKTKGAPMKAKGNLDKDVGRFKTFSVMPNFKLDERLNWTRDDEAGGWHGTLKPWRELVGNVN